MKIDIDVLRMALFMVPRQKLDLDTGSIWWSESESAKAIQRGRLIPTLSEAPICQAYLRMLNEIGLTVDEQQLFSQTHCQSDENRPLSSYPCYEFDHDPFDQEMRTFVLDFFHYIEEISDLLKEDRKSDSPKYPLSFPFFDEYYKSVTRQKAIELCKQEGYEWYSDL